MDTRFVCIFHSVCHLIRSHIRLTRPFISYLIGLLMFYLRSLLRHLCSLIFAIFSLIRILAGAKDVVEGGFEVVNGSRGRGHSALNYLFYISSGISNKSLYDNKNTGAQESKIKVRIALN